MKKLFYLLVALIVGAVCISASPSLDGRAVVADNGTFPPGLFAKTVGYLPGDSISVTNPANGQVVEILVIGSLDPSEGVAILLSPEAADFLQIKKNANMLVKLTKRSGDLDENVSGNCVLTQGSMPVKTEGLEEELEELEEELAEAEEELNALEAVEAIGDLEDVEDEVLIEEEIAELEEEIEEIEDEIEIVEEELAEAEAEEAEEIIEEEVLAEIEDDYVAPEEEGIEEEDLPEEYVEEIEEETLPEIVDNYVAPETEAVEEDELPPEESMEEEVVEEVEELPPSLPKNAFVPDSEAIDDEELPPEEIIEEVEEEIGEDDFEAIVLVPSDENPPEVNPSSLIAESVVVEEIEEPVEEVKPVVEKETSASIKYISSYEKGKYYIQIAAYKNIDNVNEVYSKYGKKYPIVVEKRGDKNVVLIGPLNVDEYGTVLQRFRSFGFKDAFIKK